MADVPEHPIAYTALRPGTPVRTNDGQQFATVEAVLVDELVSVFDGIVVQTPDGARFVDAPEVARITDRRVTLTIDRDAVRALPAPAPAAAVPATGVQRSVNRWRRRLGL